MLAVVDHLASPETATAPSARGRIADLELAKPRRQPRLFDGINRLQNLDTLLTAKAEKIILRYGVAKWSAAGGIVRADGLPTLGSPSTVAYRLLRDVIDAHRAFRFTDESGTHWAATVCDSPPEQASWTALAIGADFPLELFELQTRQNILSEAGDFFS